MVASAIVTQRALVIFVNTSFSCPAYPFTVAYQSQLLELKPFQKVLEIGTGSAYQAVVLAELGAQVYTIERQKNYLKPINHFHFLKNFHPLNFFMAMGLKGYLLTALLIK